MVPIRVEKGKLEFFRDAVYCPGHGIEFVAAHDEAPDLLLEVGLQIGVAQSGQVAGDALDGFGDDILVLYRLQRHADAGHKPDLSGPLSAAVDDGLASDSTRSGNHGGDVSVRRLQTGNFRILDDPGAVLPGAPGERLGKIRGTGLPVRGKECGTDQVANVHQRPQIACLSWSH